VDWYEKYHAFLIFTVLQYIGATDLGGIGDHPKETIKNEGGQKICDIIIQAFWVTSLDCCYLF
jgi:hypothetical protein